MSAEREAREAAGTLRLVLERVESGQLRAPGGVVRRLQGSLAALDAVAKRGKR